MKFVACGLALGLALCVRVASGGDAESAAHEAYSLGERLVAEGKLRDAALAFAEADRLVPADAALESAVRAAAGADDPVLVMTLVQQAETAQRPLPAVVDARARFAGTVGRLTIPCLAARPACSATVDQQATLTSSTFVSPGPHRVKVEQGTRQRTENIHISGGEERVLELPQELAVPARPVVPTPPPREEDLGGISPWWLALGGGVALGFGGAALATGLLTSSAERDLETLQAAGGSTSEQQEIVDRGQSLALLTNVFIGATAATAGATLLVGIFAVGWQGTEPASKPGAALLLLPGGGLLVFESAF